MDERYIARYPELYARHWWWRARERVILDALRRAAPSGGWRRILDVGCGSGLFFDRLAAFGEVEGVDPAAVANGPWAERIHVAPFDETFNPGRRYSLILFLDVLEHLEDPVRSLRTAGKLLESGGLLLITVPAFPQLWTRHDDLNRHRTRYTLRTLSDTLASAGFAVTEARYFFHGLAVAKLLARAWERIVPGEPSAPEIPPYPVNRGLELGCVWETRALAPLRLPFGSSLMALARPLPRSDS